MKLKIIGWESNGLRCPDIKLDLRKNSELPKVYVFQMRNGVGKTTTKDLIKSALSGKCFNKKKQGNDWEEDDIVNLFSNEDKNTEGFFQLNLEINDKPLSYRINFDKNNKSYSYQTFGTNRGTEDKHVKPLEVSQYLTKDFIELFFFDGENAENLFESDFNDASRAIEKLGQIYLLENSIKKLDDYDNTFVKKDKNVTTDKGLKQKETKRDRLKKSLEKYEKLRKEKEIEKSNTLNLLNNINKKLDEYEKNTEQFEAENKILLEELQNAQAETNKFLKETYEKIINPSLINEKILNNLISFKNNLTKKKLPKNASKIWFDEIIEDNICICGREICEEHKKKILENKENFLGDELTNTINSIKTSIDDRSKIDVMDDNGWLDDSIVNLKKSNRSLKNVTQKIQLFEEEKKKHSPPEIKKLYNEKTKLDKQLDNLDKILNTLNEAYDINNSSDEKTRSISSLKFQYEKIKDEIASIKGTVDERNKIKKLSEILDSVKNITREEQKKILIKECNKKLDKLWNGKLKINDITDKIILNGQPIGSEGQGLTVAYIFITSLTTIGGNEFPFIVDSPVGSLDNTRRLIVGKLVPSLIPNFITFVTPSEKSGLTDHLSDASNGSIVYSTMMDVDDFTKPFLDDVPKDTDKIQKNYNNNQITEIFVEDNKVFLKNMRIMMSYEDTTNSTSTGSGFWISKECRDWFKDLIKNSNYFKTLFDPYYFSFLIGALANKKTACLSNDSVEISRNFIGKYAPQKNIIIGCLIRAEIVNKGLDMNKRRHIEKLLVEILDSDSSSNLSSKGLQIMNDFSYGGFRYLSENINTMPNTDSSFFITYNKLLEKI